MAGQVRVGRARRGSRAAARTSGRVGRASQRSVSGDSSTLAEARRSSPAGRKPWPGALPEAARRAAPELERGARSEEGGDATRRDMLPGGTRERHLRSKVR